MFQGHILNLYHSIWTKPHVLIRTKMEPNNYLNTQAKITDRKMKFKVYRRCDSLFLREYNSILAKHVPFIGQKQYQQKIEFTVRLLQDEILFI